MCVNDVWVDDTSNEELAYQIKQLQKQNKEINEKLDRLEKIVEKGFQILIPASKGNEDSCTRCDIYERAL